MLQKQPWKRSTVHQVRRVCWISLFVTEVRTDLGYGALDEEDEYWAATGEDSKSGSMRVRKGSEPDAKQAADKKRRASFMRDVPRTDTTLKGLTTIVPPRYFGERSGLQDQKSGKQTRARFHSEQPSSLKRLQNTISILSRGH
jgi:hypothetical protein